MPPADIDLTTVEVVKLQMEAGGVSSSDNLLQVLTTASSRAIATHLGRQPAPLEDTATDREFDERDAWDPERRELWVWDLSAEPTQVEIFDRYGVSTGSLTVADQVALQPRTRPAWAPVERLALLPGVVVPEGGYLRVRGFWGWPSIPEDVVQACVITVRSWLRSAPGGSASYGYDEGGRVVQATPEGGWMLPIAAKQLLRSHRRIGAA